MDSNILLIVIKEKKNKKDKFDYMTECKNYKNQK